MLEAAEGQLREVGSLSLDTAARAAEVSKAGLMYHFRTKEVLMSAVVDRIMDRYEAGLTALLPGEGDPATATVRERLAAYVTWSCEAELDVSDLVMFTDPRLRESLTRRWIERFEPWLAVPTDLPSREQSRLLSARLLADGVWLAGASGTLPLTASQRAGVRRVALDLLEVSDD